MSRVKKKINILILNGIFFLDFSAYYKYNCLHFSSDEVNKQNLIPFSIKAIEAPQNGQTDAITMRTPYSNIIFSPFRYFQYW